MEETLTKPKKPRLTKKQKDFAKEYLDTGNGTQSALKAYDTKSAKVASVIAVENLAKPSVRAYLEDKAEKAAEIIYDIAVSGENDNVRLGASKDILDRAGYKPIEKSLNVVVTTDLDPKMAQNFDEYLRGELKESASG